MNRAAWLLALVPALVGGSSACSKFSAESGDGADAGAADASTTDGGAPALEHQIYVYGGRTVPGGSSLTSAYVSTVAANGDLSPWVLAPGLDDDRYAAAWVQNGNALLAAGGAASGLSYSSDVVRGTLPTDPANPAKAWLKTASMATGRHYASALARDATIYVSGGRSATIALGNIERYDPAKNTWSAVGSLRASVAGHATFLRSSQMYVVGGDTLATTNALTASVQRASFADNDGSLLPFESAGDLPAPIARHSIALVEPWVFVIGGDGTSGSAVATISRGRFDPAGMLAWELLPPLIVPPGQTGLAEACTVVIDHTIYVIGGRDIPGSAAKTAVYIGSVDAEGDIQWRQSPHSLLGGRAAFGCAVSPSSAP